MTQSVIVGLDPTIFLMKQLRFLLLVLIFPLLFTSCLADYLNEKMGYKVPVTITYVSEYGKTPSRKKIKPGSVITSQNLPELTDSTIVFLGWYTDKEYLIPAQEDMIIDDDLVLYARWKYYPYVVKYYLLDVDDIGTEFKYIPELTEYLYSDPGNNQIPLSEKNPSNAEYEHFDNISFLTEYQNSGKYTCINYYYYDTYVKLQNFGKFYNSLPYDYDHQFDYKIKISDPDNLNDITYIISAFSSHDEKKYFELDLSNCNFTEIPDSTFYICRGLTNITIPDSVTSIGYRAFAHCRGLTHITIPDSVTSIGHSAFEDCSELTSITLPDSVSSIGEWAFAVCSALTNITIPDGVTSISDYAFSSCRELTSITIPDSVTSIGGSAFIDCRGLKNITLPDSVTSIGEWAFAGCSALTSITIPAGITRIAEYAFRNCELSTVNYRGSETQWQSITIESGNDSLTNATIVYNYTGN